ncbi:uncharacterized protein TNCV_612881 [Trichonephila clavipes]|nr:uncharacterized protein TNCV_612881 [Trichonephila clavipes]
MAYFGKGRIAELRYIAKQLGEKVNDDLKIIDLKNLIVNSPNYEEFVREMLSMIIEKRLKTSTSHVSKYFDLNEIYILSTNELKTPLELKKHNSKTKDKVRSKSKSVSLNPCTIRSKKNGVVMPVLRETGASLDIGCEKYAAPQMLTETQQKSKESAPLIQKIENGINNEVRDQEIAPVQLVPVRREIFSKLNVNRVGPLPIIPGSKHILPGMSMSLRCHEAVPVPEMASTPLVEALPQIFRRVFPREIQADIEALLMSILTTELLQKLGTYCPLRVPFRLKNAFYCFSMLMAELPQGHEKFDLSYFDNVVVFSEGWDFPIDHMDGILELNTHLAVRPAEFELAQDGVEYCSHVVGLGKQSPAQLKVRAIIDFSIPRGPSKNRTFPSSEKVLSRGRSCGECSEEVGEKGFLESGSPTFRIDSSGKDMRRTGFEDPD